MARQRSRGRWLWLLACTMAGVVLAGGAAGCFEVEDRLTVNPDGSGSVHIETVCYFPSEGTGMMDRGRLGRGGGAFYPPMQESEAHWWFPGDDFTVQAKEETTEGGQTRLVLDASFKDINALLKSPYGRAHSLRLTREGDQLVLMARYGAQFAGHLEGMEKAAGAGAIPMETAPFVKNKDKLRVRFAVTMPGAVTAEGAAVTGNTATWSVEAAKAADAAPLSQALDSVLVARCPGVAARFEPQTPARLDLWTFKDLKEGEAPGAPAPIDVEAVRKAVRFVPCTLTVTRSFDLAGEGFHGENGASLFGIVLLPRPLAPARWGDPTLKEAADDRGNDLMPGERDRYFSGRVMSRMALGFMQEEEEGKGAAESDPNVRHEVMLGLKPPPQGAKKIVTLKADVPMYYTGGGHVLKVENVVPKDAILEMGPDRAMMQEPPGTAITSPQLQELGVGISTVQAVRTNGVTVLNLRVESESAIVGAVQIFDAEGRPWQSMVISQGFDEESGLAPVLVVGYPEGPLSMAFLINAQAKVMVPIELRDLPIAPARPKAPAEEKTEKAPVGE